MSAVYQGFTLDPFQEEALQAIDRGQSTIVAAPTGSGKTLIAEYAIARALEAGERVVYTAPIKAISNQKFRDFTKRWGEDKVGILTGDVAIRPEAPCCIMTTEIFRNCIFEGTRLEKVRWCVFDEIHFIHDEERGTVWEESIIFAPPQIRFVCLSATLPNLDELAGWMSKTRGSPFAVISTSERPVPLEHKFYTPMDGPLDLAKLKKVARPWKPPHEHEDDRRGRKRGYGRQRREVRRPPRPPRPDPLRVIDSVARTGRLPCLYFAFGRRACQELATAQSGKRWLSREEEARALALFDDLAKRFDLEGTSGAVTLRRLVQAGVAYHHAGMLPTMKEIVEQLFGAGLLKILFATETFALGVNMPAASVIFDDIHKFDGIDFDVLKVRDYQQMAGRAGRRGMDDRGTVFAQTSGTPEDARACAHLVNGKSEPIESRFQLSYATILNLLGRLGDRLLDVAERSFAAYQAEHGPGGMPPRELLSRRLEILKKFRYCDGNRLTDKGRFAARVFGYEVQVAELVWAKRLADLDEKLLAALFVAMVYEPRKGTWHRPVQADDLEALRERFQAPVEAIRLAEDRRHLPLLTKGFSFHLSAAAMAWVEGAGFGELRDHAALDPGDLIRCFRQAIQVMRQTRQALPADQAELKARLKATMTALNRDEVDAEKQLRGAVEDAPPGPTPA